ncbi:DUF3291 domain-containing protein [Phenylobacterium sp.]
MDISPAIGEAADRLEELQARGPSPSAFSLRAPYDADSR